MSTSLLIPPKARFLTTAGLPLVGGKVYTYTAGTLTPQTSYTDSTGGTPNANPVILDSAGQADIWLSGNYKIVLQDSLGVTQWTVDNVTSINSVTTSQYLVTTGSANAYILTPTPGLTSYIAGQQFYIKFNVTNTAASTINISGLGPINIVTLTGSALVNQSLNVNSIYIGIYDGTNLRMINSNQGWNLIGQATASASTSITLSGTGTGTGATAIYNSYWIRINNLIPSSNGSDFRLEQDNLIGSITMYGQSTYTQNSATTIATFSGTSYVPFATNIKKSFSAGGTVSGYSGNIWIDNASNVNSLGSYADNTNNTLPGIFIMGGSPGTALATATQAFILLPSAGNFTSGNVQLYGAF